MKFLDDLVKKYVPEQFEENGDWKPDFQPLGWKKILINIADILDYKYQLNKLRSSIDYYIRYKITILQIAPAEGVYAKYVMFSGEIKYKKVLYWCIYRDFKFQKKISGVIQKEAWYVGFDENLSLANFIQSFHSYVTKEEMEIEKEKSKR